jgi:hypothetical protein
MKGPPPIHSDAVQRLVGRVQPARFDRLLLAAMRVDSTYFDAYSFATGYARCLEQLARQMQRHDFSASVPNMDRLYELVIELRERTHAFETLVHASLPPTEAEAVLGAIAEARGALRAEQETTP